MLFNFPSRYLFTIGPVEIFSLRSSLRPALRCISKQRDSQEKEIEPVQHADTRSYGSYTLRGVIPAFRWDRLFEADLEFAWLWGLEAIFSFTQHSAAGWVAREVLRWALPFSVAPTQGIPIGFFSTADLYA